MSKTVGVTGAASCVADDKDLPSVPPLELSVPADYPAQSPLWIDRQWQYGGWTENAAAGGTHGRRGLALSNQSFLHVLSPQAEASPSSSLAPPL